MPKANPSQYSKRWCNGNLSSLRAKFSDLRNQAWQFMKQSHRCLSLEEDAPVAKYEFQKIMKKSKKQNWDDFLDDIKNIWQAARYSRETGSWFTLISKLKDKFNNKEVTNKKEIATTPLSSFFPFLLPYFTSASSRLLLQLQMPLITEKNVKLSCFYCQSLFCLRYWRLTFSSV